MTKTVTIEEIEAAIKKEQYHVFEGTTLTVCLLTLDNGFTVLGESACADPELFDAETGRSFARQAAISKCWPLLGFRLRDQLSKIEG